MAFGKKKSREELTSGDLSAEFFGDGSVATPGQNEAEDDGTVGLLQAVTGAGISDNSENEADSYSLFDTGKGSVDLGPDYNKKSWLSFGGGDNPELNPYAAEQDKRFALDERTVKLIRISILAVFSLVAGILLPSVSYNTEFVYSISGLITCIRSNVGAAFELLGGDYHGQAMYFKACAYVVASLAGLALAVTGAVYQGTLKNALVSPTTLGINSGAQVGVAIFVLIAPVAVLDPLGLGTIGIVSVSDVSSYYDSLSFSEYLLVAEGKAFASIVGCFAVVLIVMLVSMLIGRGRSTSYGLIICGQVVALVFSAVIELIRYYVIETDETGIRSSVISSNQGGMTAGSIYTLLDVALVGIPVIVCLVIVLLMRNRLNLLAFSDEEARSMGVSTELLRWVLIGVCTIMTAVVLAFCGNTNFVGFMVPLIVRRYVGPDLKYLLPASAAMGCLCMTLTYWITDLDLLYLLFRIELPISVNVFTSVVGAIAFAFMALGQRRENRSADWL